MKRSLAFALVRRRLLSGGSVGLAAAVLAGFALMAPGYPTADVELNDGGVWVTNSSELLVGRLNRQIDELDAALTSTADDVDVVQQGSEVFAVQPTSGTLQRVDVAYAVLDADVRVPGGAGVGLGGGTLTVLDPASGAVWIRASDQISGLDIDVQDPDLVLGAGGTIAVGPTGVVAGVSVADDELTVVDPTKGTRTVPLGRDVETATVTVVGNRPVVLDAERAELITDDGASHGLGEVGTPTLQEPGPAADGVLVATDEALLDIPLEGGSAERLADGAGGPIAPVRVAGCAHAAWAGSPTYQRVCSGRADFRAEIRPAESGLELRFRVNRSVVVLNALESGMVWLLDQEMTVAENWDDVRPPDPEDQTEEQSDAVDQSETLERNEQNQPPVANDDEYGARPGLPTLLPVLDNDTDPDGDVLIVRTVTGPDEARGAVSIVDDSRRLQFTAAAGATGSMTFGYTIDDGRGGADDAQVTVNIHPLSQNEAPRQVRESKTVTEQGSSVTHGVLDAWIDPDGDELSLMAAAVTTADTVRFTADGRVTFIDSGTVPGLKKVTLDVTDSRLSGSGELAVEVRPPGQLPPTARGDHVTAFVGETVTVSPLINDSDPNQDPLRLSAVDAPVGVQIVPDYVAGTFTLTAATIGTYYLIYTVVDGPNSAQALVRADVLPGGTNSPPVAVRDLAFVPSAGSTVVDVLANDVDVDGDVLVVTGVSVSEGSGLSVSVRDHRFLTIASASLLPGPITVTYTASDGSVSAQGGVIVRSTPPNAVNQPPVALPDTATVRAGDVLTLDVLSNDSDPDGDVLTLLPQLAEPASAGSITVIGNRLHVQAPNVPGTVRAVYAVTDTAGQTASSLVTVYVRPKDGHNSPPTPVALTGRALAGSETRIDVPLAGIDPDGDSTRVVGVGAAPTKGRIVEVGTGHLIYEAYDETGTDTFSYVVEDRLGARGTATLKVGIAPRTPGNQPPVTQDDTATTRPGRAVSVDVRANDADPDGDPLLFTDDPFTGAPEQAEVHLDGGRVSVVAPDSGQLTVAYAITDGRGGEATGYLTVTADSEAPLKPPVAVDDVVSTDVLKPGEFVPVDVLDNDSDPDGSTADLSVAVGVGNDVARVDDDGRVLVRGISGPQTIPYTVTDADGQSATAVVLVPAAANLPPRMKPGASPVTVGDGGESWSLADLVVDPEGKQVRLTRSRITATKSDGGSLADGETTLRFTPALNYAGPASLTFEVTDGSGPDDPEGRTAFLTLAITIDTDANQRPVFAGASLSASPGEDAVSLDLAPLVTDPDDDDPTFALPAMLPAGFDIRLDGTVLRVAAADTSTAGVVARLDMTVTDGSNPPQPAPVDLRVTTSNRPLARAVADSAEADQGSSVSVDVLANDANPFPDAPLKVTTAAVVAGTAVVAVDGNEVTVTPGNTFIGTVTVKYSVRDKTGDAAREVAGVLSVTVRGVPGQPVAPTVLEIRDSTVVLSWPSPAANGAPILDYQVTADGVSRTCPTTTCTIDGLRNGTTYRFTLTARNDVGNSPASPTSGPARPDSQPDAPDAPTATFGDASLDVEWTAPRNTGSAITHFEVELSPGGAAVRVGGTGYTFTGLTNGQSYQVRVRAFNGAPDPSEWSAYSAPEVPAGVPARPDAPTAAAAGGELGGQVQVDWAQPDTNGAPIDSYTLKVLRNGGVVSTFDYPGGTRSATVTADNANNYTFVVSATNKAGVSQESAPSAAVRVYGRPDTIGSVSASPGDQSATLSFTAPNDGGQAIDHYEVQINGGGASTLGGNRVITGLANGNRYTFAVRACNTYCGQWSAASNEAVPYGPPNPPGQVTATGSWKAVSFSWTAAAENGRPIARYEFSIDGGGWQNAGMGTSAGPIGDGYFQSHSIQVRAVDSENQAGPARGATGNTSSPTVAVSKGSGAVGAQNPGRQLCVHASCAYVVVSVTGIAPGDYAIKFWDDAPGEQMPDRPISVGGSGNASVQTENYFGYPGNRITATVDGITSPQFTWY
ncbi:MAG: tandem-95 repeat protein [Blastococcus sp.]|nr:tandem-95 repeat protein [Blastococcus sp.]